MNDKKKMNPPQILKFWVSVFLHTSHRTAHHRKTKFTVLLGKTNRVARKFPRAEYIDTTARTILACVLFRTVHERRCI